MKIGGARSEEPGQRRTEDFLGKEDSLPRSASRWHWSICCSFFSPSFSFITPNSPPRESLFPSLSPPFFSPLPVFLARFLSVRILPVARGLLILDFFESNSVQVVLHNASGAIEGSGMDFSISVLSASVATPTAVPGSAVDN